MTLLIADAARVAAQLGDCPMLDPSQPVVIVVAVLGCVLVAVGAVRFGAEMLAAAAEGLRWVARCWERFHEGD